MKQFRDTPYYVTENGEVYRSSRKLKPQDNGFGYLQVKVYHNKKYQMCRLNRMVAECYIPNPNNLPEVNHHDGNKLNNNILNLYWCTPSQNIKHAYRIGLMKTKLTEEQVKWIKQNYIPQNKIYGQNALAKKFNVHQKSIFNIVNNKTWNHLNPEQSSES